MSFLLDPFLLAPVGGPGPGPDGVVQFAGDDDHAQVTFAVAPTLGNLLIAIVFHWSNSPSATSGWTQLSNSNGSTGDGVWIGYKYAGVSEPTTQAACNDGTIQFSAMWEIEGVTGVAATDIPFYHSEFDKTAAPTYTTTSFNTGQAKTLVLGFIGGEVSTAVTATAPSVGSGQTVDGDILYNGAIARRGSAEGLHQVFAANAAAVSYAATFAQTQTVLARSGFVEVISSDNAGGGGGGGGEVPVPGGAMIDIDGASGQYMVPMSGLIDDE